MKNKEKLYIMSYELDSWGKITSIGMGVIKDNCPEIVGYIQPEMLGYFAPKESVFVFIPNSSGPNEKDIKPLPKEPDICGDCGFETKECRCKLYEKDLKKVHKSLFKMIKELKNGKKK